MGIVDRIEVEIFVRRSGWLGVRSRIESYWINPELADGRIERKVIELRRGARLIEKRQVNVGIKMIGTVIRRSNFVTGPFVQKIAIVG